MDLIKNLASSGSWQNRASDSSGCITQDSLCTKLDVLKFEASGSCSIEAHLTRLYMVLSKLTEATNRQTALFLGVGVDAEA